ncbi:MAG: polyprenyl synthetase family protein [Bacteroidales bacterium]|nr:polyprenyl synthetase family protein [Bacteroidales bacterium]
MNIENRLQDVRNEYRQRLLHVQGTLLQQVDAHALAHQGKMLRPQLTLLAAALLGNEALQSRITMLKAVAVEMLHNASLLHDDVIDQASQRRGQPSVNNKWNEKVAILVGDYHLALLMQLLDEINDRETSRRINDTVIAMCRSELLQQEVLAGREMDCDIYQQIIEGKTARLFATACAIVNPALETFGLHFGCLFQLRDDMQDAESTIWTAELANQHHTLAYEQLMLLPGSPQRQTLLQLLA